MNLMEKYLARMTNNKEATESPNKPISLHETGLGMPLSDFEKTGLILKVWSEVLKEHVYFVSSEAVLNRNPLDAVVYTAQELQAMLEMTPEEVKAAHEVKRAFHKAKIAAHKEVI